MNQSELITYHLTLATLSPVHIGTGKENTLSPVADYIIEKVSYQPVCIFIDANKLQEAIGADQVYAEEYVKEVSKVLNGKTQFDLRAFIQRTLKKKIETFQTRCLPIYGKIDAKIQLHPHITNAGRVYIPGSSIKGAIRTALLYRYFKQTEEGRKEVEEFLQHLKQYSQIRQQLRDVMRNRELQEKERRELEKKCKGDLSEQSLFGKLGEGSSSDARFLRVSDTDSFEERFLAIREVERKNIRNVKRRGASQFYEVIEKGGISCFTISIEPKLKHQSLQFLNQNDFSQVAECVNQFSMDCIEYELSELESSPDKNELLDLIAFYQSLQNQVRNALEKKAPLAFLRIGQHKTYFDNSLGLLLYKQDKEAFRTMREVLGIGRNARRERQVEAHFPETRGLATPNLAMGWIGITTDTELGRKLANYISTAKTAPTSTTSQAAQPPNTVRAIIIDDQSKPPKVKILEGEFAEKEIQMPGVNLTGLGLAKGSEVYVKLELSRDRKRLEKVTYKAKAQ